MPRKSYWEVYSDLKMLKPSSLRAFPEDGERSLSIPQGEDGGVSTFSAVSRIAK